MDQSNPIKLKFVVGSLQFEYEGSETFLQAQAHKIVHEIYGLQLSTLRIAANTLQDTIREARDVQATLAESATAFRTVLDSMSELSEMDRMRLQMEMDHKSKFEETLSNLLKKMSDTANNITQNLK